jgi:peptide/nickel transport system ATP-binding protein
MDQFTFDIKIVADGKPLVDIGDFSLERNRVTILLGESGIGKSIISRGICGFLDPAELTVTVNGLAYEDYLHTDQVRGIRRDGFFVFQEPSSHLNPLMTLADQIGEGSFSGASGMPGVLRTLWEGTAGEELDSILSIYPKPYRPSGGEKQRILLAMALEKIDMLPESPTPEALFVFDEPSGSLDNRYRDLFLSLLFDRYRKRPFTILLITHDYSMISRISGSHSDIMDKVQFRELTRGERGLALRDFQPGTYTAWVDDLRRSAESRRASHEQEPLLTIEPRLEVFGRTLVITKDPGGKMPERLVVPSGRMVFVKAPSGTGKTTLVKRVMGLIQEGTFEATLKGIPLTDETPRRFWQERVWGKRMTMVFQHADEALNMHSTMRETLLGLPLREPLTSKGLLRLIGDLFEGSEAGVLQDKEIRLLSGGQKQRLNLLRGLALDTDVLILDEPLNGLDFESATKVISMLRQKMEAGMGLLVISHNEEIFDALAGEDQTYYLHAV